jgi:hypothetical protein
VVFIPFGAFEPPRLRISVGFFLVWLADEGTFFFFEDASQS